MGLAPALLPDQPGRSDDGTQAAAILAKSAQMYGSLRSLQVKVRTEIPVQPEPLRLVNHVRWRDNRRVGLLESGAWVKEHEYRVVRGEAVRWRSALVGAAGSSRSYLPQATIWVDYTQGFQVQSQASHPFGRVQFADGKYYTGVKPDLSPSLNLPLGFFLEKNVKALVAPKSVSLAGTEAQGGRPCHVLRIETERSVMRDAGG